MALVLGTYFIAFIISPYIKEQNTYIIMKSPWIDI